MKKKTKPAVIILRAFSDGHITYFNKRNGN